MSDTSVGINAQNAGLFSAAAYTAIGDPVNYGQLSSGTTPTYLPVGWSEWSGINVTDPTQFKKYSDSTNNQPNGNNEFRIFINTAQHQIVIAFKGSSTLANWKSDLNTSDEGATQYNAILAAAQAALGALRGNAALQGYTIFTDGHSLGGEMAQAFALKNNLDGFSQNALPIATGLQKPLTQYLPTGSTNTPPGPL